MVSIFFFLQLSVLKHASVSSKEEGHGSPDGETDTEGEEGSGSLPHAGAVHRQTWLWEVGLDLK